MRNPCGNFRGFALKVHTSVPATVDTAGLSPAHTELANRLAKDIATLDEAAAREMLETLKEAPKGYTC